MINHDSQAQSSLIKLNQTQSSSIPIELDWTSGFALLRAERKIRLRGYRDLTVPLR